MCPRFKGGVAGRNVFALLCHSSLREEQPSPSASSLQQGNSKAVFSGCLTQIGRDVNNTPAQAVAHGTNSLPIKEAR